MWAGTVSDEEDGKAALIVVSSKADLSLYLITRSSVIRDKLHGCTFVYVSVTCGTKKAFNISKTLFLARHAFAKRGSFNAVFFMSIQQMPQITASRKIINTL